MEKYLIHNPYLTAVQIKTAFKRNSLAHFVLLGIAFFALFNNLSTRNTYAGEFNKKSILAELFTDNADEDIVETSVELIEYLQKPKTESILEELSALGEKLNDENEKSAAMASQPIALSQGGEAVIRPNITPFGEEEKEMAPSAVTGKNKQIITYTIESGDTLTAIASKFDVSVNTLLWENNLSLSSYINPGDSLAILPVNGVSYTIQSGDTLSAIASKLGSSVEKIIAYNDLESAGVIKAKQKLIIPDGKLNIASPLPTRSIYTPSALSPSSNNFLWPAISQRITQYYSWRHAAIDIGDKTGNPIYASQSGRVEKAGWATGYGNSLLINHGNGVKTLYAHASKLYASRGDQVKQGDIIGAVGSTGWSTGPHLHFEIIINGSKVNPLTYL